MSRSVKYVVVSLESAWGPTIASLPFSIGIRIEGNNNEVDF